VDQLLIALDVESAPRALTLVDTLRGVGGGFKIGNELFTAAGPGLVREVVNRGARVFLDLKFHDIPNTVAGAVRSATRLGVWMLNVHASGGRDMMRAAREAAAEEAVRHSRDRPIVIAVTVLTSLGDSTLASIGVTRGAAAQVEALATQALEAGLDGVVASPREIEKIRRACGDAFVIVTPGIRTASASGQDDQVRTASARGAIAAGASYIVVGRPIIAAPDPRAAAEQLAAECA
jgi:orotidine-5'-phosphate decarboxylase